ncbi:MAG TPA: DNA mismatch repair protein MutS [Caulobacteraceae bacterium]
MDQPAIPDPIAAAASPVMAQYFAAKARQPDALLLFRMGDFYELFFDDAAQAASAIGIALTQRGTHAGAPIPMAGVPAHAVESYLAKLVRAGFKVAICDQVENPAEARRRGSKAVVRRELVRVVTPGTLTDDTLLNARGANRLAAVALRADQVAVAAVELSTGEVECLLVRREGVAAALSALQPSEVLVTDRLFGELAGDLEQAGGAIETMPAALAEPAAAEARLKRLYGVASLDGFGPLAGAEVAALGLIAAHLEITQAGTIPALRPPRRSTEAAFMSVDPATRISLEIECTLAGQRQGSLIATIDRTVTGPGARRLAARLNRPLLDIAAINERLDAVAWFVDDIEARRQLRELASRAGDMARALSRLALGRGGPRDLGAFVQGLEAGSKIGAMLGARCGPLVQLPKEIADAARALDLTFSAELAALHRALSGGLATDLPLQARDGGFVGQGVSAELDETRSLRDDSRRIVATLEIRLAEQAGVPLKIRHNAVLGYFVETNARHADTLRAPPHATVFIHRQSLANQARFTTVELAELDGRIARAAEQALGLELAIFEQWRGRARALAPSIQAAAEALAALDVASALAEWAVEVGAVRPVLDEGVGLSAAQARHPVVESAVRRAGEAFTANDCRLDGAAVDGPRLAIVTGPNMAGKSTFLRQNAVLAILAQAGSFVPAAELRLGLVDRLFSRVGAGDDLGRGRSTFLTEMIETAAILNQATARSLVIVDEIGRGTATWDGLAIAWACAEALHTIGCRTLFATHYHELASLEERLAGVANLCLKAKEWNGKLVFLHEASSGCADRSYGVHVAALAGTPAPVVSRARVILERLEAKSASTSRLAELPLFAAPEAVDAPPSAVEEALGRLDIDGMSPREAQAALYRLKTLLRGRS